MTQISMTATAIAFVGVDTTAQRLCVAWPLAAAAAAQDPDVDRAAKWAEYAGVALVVAQRTGSVLLRHGLLREDGTIADAVVAVLNGLALRKVKELKR